MFGKQLWKFLHIVAFPGSLVCLIQVAFIKSEGSLYV